MKSHDVLFHQCERISRAYIFNNPSSSTKKANVTSHRWKWQLPRLPATASARRLEFAVQSSSRLCRRHRRRTGSAKQCGLPACLRRRLLLRKRPPPVIAFAKTCASVPRWNTRLLHPPHPQIGTWYGFQREEKEKKVEVYGHWKTPRGLIVGV